MGTLTEIALFAGAGGGVWASQELGHRVVCYVEREPYCVQVLKARIDDGSFPDAPIWDDVFTFDGHPWRGRVDLISAGFPCQPFSVAGAQLGADDPRNGWPATARIIREVRPRYVFLENVPGLASNGYLGTVLGDLAACGYDAEWSCLSAQQVGAPHKRDRIWILAAHTDREPIREQPDGVTRRGCSPEPWTDGAQGALANPDDTGRIEQRRAVPSELGRPAFECSSWWASEPGVGRVAHELANRSNRLKSLGNGQVPQCAVAAFNGLMQRHEVKQ